MDIVTLGIQMLGGAVGGNLVARAMKAMNVGFIGNTIFGLIGGAAGSYLLNATGFALTPVDFSAIDPVTLVSQLLLGGAGGSAMLAIASPLRKVLQK